MLTYRNNAKKVRKKKLPKLDIYDDSMLDLLDELASKWALRADTFARYNRRKATS